MKKNYNDGDDNIIVTTETKGIQNKSILKERIWLKGSKMFPYLKVGLQKGKEQKLLATPLVSVSMEYDAKKSLYYDFQDRVSQHDS